MQTKSLGSRYTGATILSIVYGYDVQRADDPLVMIAEEAVRVLASRLVPGALIVNTLPFREFSVSDIPKRN